MPPRPSSVTFPTMEVCVISRVYSNRLMIVLALVGTLAVLTGVVLGIDASRSPAGAAPAMRPAGTLGVGAGLVAPVVSPRSASDKVSAAQSPVTITHLKTTIALAAAPIPRPVPRKKPARSSAGVHAAGSTVAGGWKSARVSWYGPGFYGRKTASGAVLTQGMMNVAHRSLPFGTRIQFEYNGRSVIAVVNDRGPFVGGRTFDLGPGTATALGFGGVHAVKYRILGR